MAQKMKPEYAQKLFNVNSYVFGNRFFSYRDDFLVVTYHEDKYYEIEYYGTQLKDGHFQLDEEGYVVFYPVRPVIDENTKFAFI